MAEERLQKVIAQAGIASRREAEKMILAGRVRVDGQVVTKLGTKVSSIEQVVVDNQPIERESHHTYLFYKPRGVISAVKDNKGRKTVADYFTDLPYRLYPVGLMHPRNEVDKVYVAKIKGILQPDEIKALKKGVQIGRYKTKPAQVKVLKTNPRAQTQIVQLTIHEGHYHQVKEMFKAVNHLVDKLSRERYSFLDLQGLTSGQYRELNHKEVD